MAQERGLLAMEQLHLAHIWEDQETEASQKQSEPVASCDPLPAAQPPPKVSITAQTCVALGST